MSKDRLKQYSFERLGEETVDTPTGSMTAIKVKRIHDNDKRQTTLWFAPAHDFLLVKLEQINDGKTYTIELAEWR